LTNPAFPRLSDSSGALSGARASWKNGDDRDARAGKGWKEKNLSAEKFLSENFFPR
jgi:hypothetical protein